MKRQLCDELHVGILVSLHLCVRAVLAKIVLLMEGEISVPAYSCTAEEL